jgi:hypothetical protein
MQVLKMISILVLCQLLGASDNINTSLQIVQNNKVSIVSNKDVYSIDDEMKFTVSCMDKGFVTILYIADNGYIGVVKNNAVCNRVYTAPDKDEPFAFVAENSERHNITERYLAFYSKKKMNTEIFKKMKYNMYYSEYGVNPLESFKCLNRNYSAITITIKG